MRPHDYGYFVFAFSTAFREGPYRVGLALNRDMLMNYDHEVMQGRTDLDKRVH